MLIFETPKTVWLIGRMSNGFRQIFTGNDEAAIGFVTQEEAEMVIRDLRLGREAFAFEVDAKSSLDDLDTLARLH